MFRKLGLLLLVVAASTLVFPATAVADPTGDDYFAFSTNAGIADLVPNVSGGLPGSGVLLVPLVWNGIPTTIPLPPDGNTAIPRGPGFTQTYTEQNLPFPGNPVFAATPGTGYEHAGGEFIENGLTTDTPFGFLQSTDNLGEQFISWLDIDWTLPDAGPHDAPNVTGSSFLYFTANGVPVPMSDPFGNDLTFTPHPLSLNPATAGDAPPPTPGFDPTGFGIPATQVLLLGDAPFFPPPGAVSPLFGLNGSDHIISSGALATGLSYQILVAALGMVPSILQIDGFHLGIVIDEAHLPTGDIKPDSDPNSVNLKSQGKLPVAVLSDDDFDASTIDGTTVTFADQTLDEADRGLSPTQFAFEDLDGDGDIDFIAKFSISDLVDAGLLSEETGTGTVHGLTTSGETFIATDDIRLVPPGDGNGDQIVNAADYTIWADAFGATGPEDMPGDYNGDGTVNASDYTEWANSFGMDYTGLVPGAPGAGLGSSPSITPTLDSGGLGVPEPSTFVLACFGLVALLAYGRRRRR